MQPAKYVLQLLDNKFTILLVKKCNNNSNILPLCPAISAFNTCKASLYLLINKAFVDKYHLNTYRLFIFMPVYKTPNKMDQILEVVDINLWYKIHVK